MWGHAFDMSSLLINPNKFKKLKMKLTKKILTRNLRAGVILTFSVLSCTGYAQGVYTAENAQRVEKIISQMTLDEKMAIIGGTDNMYTKPLKRFGIPQLRVGDGPQGLATLGLAAPSTAYPATILLAATWNEELARRYGESLAEDCRAHGIHVILGPGVNIYRASMCGRNFEYMGEDPFLAARMSTNYIKGAQSRGVMATIKHFAANNTEIDRNRVSADVDERTLHEIYFPAFKSAVQEAKVGAVMGSYNLLNGIYTAENPWLLKDVLRKQWGFEGLVVSDWGSTHYSLPALRGGLDLEMPYANKMSPDAIKYYLGTGDISVEVIDEKVRHILCTMFAFGFDKNEQKDANMPENNPKSAKTAADVAAEGLVLLKNRNNILPIQTGKVKKIAVIGKNAVMDVFGGGSGEVKPFHYTTVLDGLKQEAKAYNIEVEYLDYYEYMPDIMFTNATKQQKGFHTEYFKNKELKGKPDSEGVENKVSHSWLYSRNAEKQPEQNYSIRWSGVIIPQANDEYRFEVSGDDGYRLFINNDQVINEWRADSYRRKDYTCKLEAGKMYDIRLEYFQSEGDARVNMIWEQKQAKSNPLVDKLNESDLVVTCFGYFDYIEGENRDRSFDLPYDEERVVNRVIQCKRPVIGVVNSGGNIGMQSWEPKLAGLLWAWYAGQDAGTAIARTLFGGINPSGKLPVTFEKRWEDNPVYLTHYDTDGDKHIAYEEGIFVGYRGYDKLKRDVQYPFGYGLSYTTFKLTDLSIGNPRSDGSVEVACKLTNVGKREGAEVVQLYIGKEGGVVERPGKELRQFKKVSLKPGESANIILKADKDAFSYYSVNQKKFVTDAGRYNVMVGTSSRDIRLQQRIDILP